MSAFFGVLFLFASLLAGGWAAINFLLGGSGGAEGAERSMKQVVYSVPIAVVLFFIGILLV